MTSSARIEKSLIGDWWRQTDRWTLCAVLGLILFGVFMVSAASPSVAERLGASPFHFVWRHIAMLPLCLALLFSMSIASPRTLWRASLVALAGAAFLVLCTLFFGAETKGATRWIRVLGFSLQPSEFLKPALAIVTAWLLARAQERPGFPGFRLALAAFTVSAGLLILQPDFGMTFVLATVFGAQICLAGLPLLWMAVMAALGAGGVFCAYMFLPHVTARIDRFLDPGSGDNYQVQKSLDAFGNGGLFGTGPAHGTVKMRLPDAHADFIFAVTGEELGLAVTLLLVCVFGFIILRSAMRARQSDDLFVILGAGGLLAQFALQSLIHMGSSLQILPAKGMTLPFISYGGSSLLAMGFGMGMLLSLTRKRGQAPGDPLWAPGRRERYA